MDKVRSMLCEIGLGAEFWAQADSTVVYIINRSSTSAIGFEVPEALCTGEDPSYEHLKMFGCVADFHTVADKISLRVTKGIFL